MSVYDPRTYQALVLAKALEIYDKTRMQVNRSYTPRRMILTATNITGIQFKSRDYEGAAKALRTWIDERKEK
jgi:hypothetical protein